MRLQNIVIIPQDETNGNYIQKSYLEIIVENVSVIFQQNVPNINHMPWINLDLQKISTHKS